MKNEVIPHSVRIVVCIDVTLVFLEVSKVPTNIPHVCLLRRGVHVGGTPVSLEGTALSQHFYYSEYMYVS